jgi:ABC-2 type transport system ATP-binding protein
MSEKLVEIKGLTKKFGPFTAVDNISFSVSRGEVLGFLGPNGAGKSTTMKMITGFLNPTAGTALVCGSDVLQNPLAVKTSIGYLPEGAPAYPDMTPASFLQFIAQIRGLSGAERDSRIDDAIEKTQLDEVLYQPIETLSKGFKRRVGLAQAILHDPEVLIMDEPTDGLDPNQKHEVRALIKKMAKDKAIILSTHILEEVDAVCTRAIIIARGKVVADGTPAQLEAKSRYHNAVTLRIKEAKAEEVQQTLESLASVKKVKAKSSQNGSCGFTVFPEKGASIAADVGNEIKQKGWDISELHVESGRLDEVFRRMTSDRKATSKKAKS